MNTGVSSTRPPPSWRALVLVAALALEALVLGVCFDAASLAASSSAVVRLFATLAGGASRFAVCLVALSLLLGRGRWTDEVGVLRDAGPPPKLGVRLFVHALSFAALFVASARLFAADVGQHGALRIVVWLAAVVATVTSWLALWGTWSVLRGVTLRIGRLVGASAAVAGVAYAAGHASLALWEPLRRSTFALVTPLVRLLVPGVELDSEASLIGTESFVVEVSAACSGYEGLGLSAVFLGTFFWLFRDRLRFPRAFLLILPVFGVMWLLNAARIAVLVAIGVHVSPELAVGSFHSYVGSLIFAAVSLGLLAIVLRTPFFVSGAATDGAAEPASDGSHVVGENTAAAYLLPFLVLVATALVSATFSRAGSQTWYPLRVLVTLPVLWTHRDALRRFLARAAPASRGASVGLLASDEARPGRWIAVATGVATLGWLVPALLRAPAASDVFAPSWSAGLVGDVTRLAWWLARVAGTVLVVPVVEELAFRGFVMRRLVAPEVSEVGWENIGAFALVGQALLFGVLHPQHVLGGVVAGLAFGWVALKTRRGGAAIAAHALTNAAVVIVAALRGRWDLI